MGWGGHQGGQKQQHPAGDSPGMSHRKKALREQAISELSADSKQSSRWILLPFIFVNLGREAHYKNMNNEKKKAVNNSSLMVSPPNIQN